ncbi:DNA-binding Lrp family transcriptional regulator [Agromyces terreus]|uniref:DNA-binding Lrp family transcriptional regulator n=1 Tax=Agromyces terreus TaxID=424795 RepID=A0A9X2H4H7_9MICO|nr:Lrp/AsnC family transcriptional regulator [Agromyces terreus]MCP2370637.1 DNA-binding Lrp family transcriptional regulator [Agromyces terreus]
MSIPLDDVDRRVAAALVQDGRAPWRRIAAAIGEPERSVARRGRRLLDEGVVRVLALPNPAGLGLAPYSLRVTATPASLREVAETLAERADVPMLSMLASSNTCVGEAYLRVGDARAFLDVLGAIPGVTAYELDPITRYHRTSSGWRPEVLTAEQQAQLGQADEMARLFASPAEFDPASEALFEAMALDGRATAESLSERLNVSTATVGNRLERARSNGQVFIRGVVSPASLGYATEAHLRLMPRLSELDAVAERLSALPMTRVCAVAGTTVVASLAATGPLPIEQALRDLAGEFPSIEPVQVDVVAEGLKRSAIRFVDDRPVSDLREPTGTLAASAR